MNWTPIEFITILICGQDHVKKTVLHFLLVPNPRICNAMFLALPSSKNDQPTIPTIQMYSNKDFAPKGQFFHSLAKSCFRKTFWKESHERENRKEASNFSIWKNSQKFPWITIAAEFLFRAQKPYFVHYNICNMHWEGGKKSSGLVEEGPKKEEFFISCSSVVVDSSSCTQC